MMMINKENGEKEQPSEPKKDDTFVDIAHMDVQCHIMIKDKDTGEVLVNKRG
jgi:hypothetical protein